MARRGRYITRVPDSQYFQIKLQYPTEVLQLAARMVYGEPVKRRERSLRVTTMAEAEVAAADMIAQHKKVLLLAGAMADQTRRWGSIKETWTMPPGAYPQADGSMVVATESEITYIGADRQIIKTEPNHRGVDIEIDEAVLNEQQAVEHRQAEEKARRSREPKDVDREAIEAYLRKKGVATDVFNGALKVLDLFKVHVGDRTINQCDFEDVEDFIQAACVEEDAPYSVPRFWRLMAEIRAMVNDGHKRRSSPFYRKANPFAGHEMPPHTAQKLVEFNERDVDAMARNLHLLPSDEERLMLAMHVASGVRPVGIYSISGGGVVEEHEMDGRKIKATHRTRWVYIAADKDARKIYGERTVAVPQAVIDLGIMPETFEGTLFKKKLPTLKKNINTWLERIGVKAEGNNKAFYSGRHRARSRFREVACPTDTSRHIMGHARDKNDSHDSYGGHRAFALKEWVDYVGFGTCEFGSAPAET